VTFSGELSSDALLSPPRERLVARWSASDVVRGGGAEEGLSAEAGEGLSCEVDPDLNGKPSPPLCAGVGDVGDLIGTSI
jgi:hypothetical protein